MERKTKAKVRYYTTLMCFVHCVLFQRALLGERVFKSELVSNRDLLCVLVCEVKKVIHLCHVAAFIIHKQNVLLNETAITNSRVQVEILPKNCATAELFRICWIAILNILLIVLDFADVSLFGSFLLLNQINLLSKNEVRTVN